MIRGIGQRLVRQAACAAGRRPEHDRLRRGVREDPGELLRREARSGRDDPVEAARPPRGVAARGSATGPSRSARRPAPAPAAPPARPPRAAAAPPRPAPCAPSPPGTAAARRAGRPATSTASSARAIRIAASSTVAVERAGERHEDPPLADVRRRASALTRGRPAAARGEDGRHVSHERSSRSTRFATTRMSTPGRFADERRDERAVQDLAAPALVGRADEHVRRAALSRRHAARSRRGRRPPPRGSARRARRRAGAAPRAAPAPRLVRSRPGPVHPERVERCAEPLGRAPGATQDRAASAAPA